MAVRVVDAMVRPFVLRALQAVVAKNMARRLPPWRHPGRTSRARRSRCGRRRARAAAAVLG